MTATTIDAVTEVGSGLERSRAVVPTVVAHASTMVVEEKTVVYDEDAHTMLVLNSSAGAVWALCDGWRTVESIMTELVGMHGADPDQIEDEVWDTVEKLVSLGVLFDGRAAPATVIPPSP